MQENRLRRYSRQTLLEEIGPQGQERLSASSVLIVGCGALGSMNANHLARAGIGKITIIDRDIVETENLQRQMLFDENDVGRPKAVAACERLESINSEVVTKAHVKDLNPNNAEELFESVDVVLDGLDNMETRYLVNDVCVKKGIPWVYGGAVSTYGMSMNIVPKETACLSCVFPQAPKPGFLPTCDTVGVLNTAPAVIASIQSTEAIKILLERAFNRQLLVYDVWSHDFQLIKIQRKADCACCSEYRFSHLSPEKTNLVTTLCGRDSVQISPAVEADISLEQMAERLGRTGKVSLHDVHLVFEQNGIQISIFSDGRAIIKGTGDRKLARSLYAKYIGI